MRVRFMTVDVGARAVLEFLVARWTDDLEAISAGVHIGRELPFMFACDGTALSGLEWI